MAISLFSLLIIQGLWIAYAIKTEKAKFDQLVYDALSSAIYKIDQRNLFEFIDKRIDLPEPKYDISINVEKIKELEEKISAIEELDHIKNLDKITVISKAEIDNGLFYIDDSIIKSNQYIVQSDNIENNTKFVVTDSSYSYSYSYPQYDSFEIISPDSLSHILHLKIYDSMEKQLQHEHTELLVAKEKVVKHKLKAFNENIGKWVMEFNYDETLFFPKVKIEEYQDILEKSLTNKGIAIDFDFQITKETDTVSTIYTTLGKGDQQELQYKTEIFPDDIFSKNLFLSLGFPGKNNLIYSKVYALLVGSIIFTLIIIITFISTIYYMQRQKKLSDIKSDFINNMTHEFKTPIATIRLATDAMESPKVMGIEKSVLYYLNIIRQENKRMNNQVERVLQMALIDQGQLQLDVQKNNVHDIIENCINVVQLSAKKKDGSISSLLKATCFEIDIDEIHFANVINNLLDNAIKYNNNKPSIIIETYNQHNQLCIKVSDNGIGMDKEVQKHIFEKFYRRPTGNVHNIKGFGLGLSYVKAIIDEHQGEISVTSEPGVGSSFLIKFNCQNKDINNETS